MPPPRILHLLDPSTPPDSFDLLAPLLPHFPNSRLVALGHRSSQLLATHAGITIPLEFLPSIGWADPTSWRPLHRLITDFQPTHLHAWGIPAIVAASMIPSKAHRIATFTTTPTRSHLRLLRLLSMRTPWTWIATSSFIEQTLRRAALAPSQQIENRKSKIENLTPPLPQQSLTASPTSLRAELEIDPTDSPLLLLAGDGHSARHDFGLWAATILSQLFPNTRALLRENPRGEGTGHGGGEDPGLSRFLNNLPNDRLITLAPASTPWPDLLAIADLMLLTPSTSTPTAPLLHALAAGVPILATPVPCITEIIQDNVNGLLSATPTPRAIAAKLEEFMNDPTLRQSITQSARAWTTTQPTATQFIEAVTAIYEPTPTLAPAS